MNKKCDIIIPIWNNLEYTKECIEAIIANTEYPYRLILVDNASDKETAAYLDSVCGKADAVLIRNSHNEGFIKAVNQGLKLSDAPFICALNNDTIPGKGWLTAMTDFADSNPDIGLINPQCSGHGALPINEYALSLRKNKSEYMEMNQCQGFCMLMSRKVLDALGCMDEAFGIGGFDDTDYSMRAHLAGFRSAAIRDAYVYHRQHASFDRSGDREQWVRRNEEIYYRKWGRPIRCAVSAAIAGDRWNEDLKAVMLLSYGLAREWSWVHIWLNSPKPRQELARSVEEVLREEGLKPHQNFKIAYFSMPNVIFKLTVLVKCLERLKPRMARKRFNALISTGPDIVSFVSPFRKLFGVRLLSIDPNEKVSWLERGREAAGSIKRRG
ncbi:MAG: glycosyltransferase family 2 protein [Candidatus Omnitrophota bacterium]